MVTAKTENYSKEVNNMEIAVAGAFHHDNIHLEVLFKKYIKEKNHKNLKTAFFENFYDLQKSCLQKKYNILFIDLDTCIVSERETFKATEDQCKTVFMTCDTKNSYPYLNRNNCLILQKPVDYNNIRKILDDTLNILYEIQPYTDIICERIPLRIYFKSILYADTFRNAVYIHTDIGTFKTYITFEKFKDSLKSDRRFIHCYKGCIVNMNRVEKVTGDDFLMDNGEKVQIRKRGGSLVKKNYLQYLLSIS